MSKRTLRAAALVVLVVIVAAWWSGTLDATAFSTWLTRLRPVSVRYVPLTEAERAAWAEANVHKYLVIGRVSAGVDLICWVETYHQGALAEDEEVDRLEVPLTSQGLTIVCSQQAIAEGGKWARYEWTLTAGVSTATGAAPYHETMASLSSGPHGVPDISNGEPAALWVHARGDQAPEPDRIASGGVASGGILTREILAMTTSMC